MTGKTKAAMPGRQCNTALLKHRQITRLAAGGQTLSQRNPYAQINRVRLTYGHRNPLKELDYNESLESAGNKHEQYSGSGQKNVKHSFLKNQYIAGLQDDGKIHHEENQQHAILQRNPYLAYERVVTESYEVNRLSLSESDNQPSLRGEPLSDSYNLPTDSGLVRYLCGTQRPSQNNPEIIGAVHSITESNPVQLSGSDLAFLRWRRLISPRIEVTINPALLSPSSLSDSISATTSCGTRTVKSCDFAFLLEVAITDSFDVWCVSVYAKKSYAQCLKCVSLECSFKSEGETHLANSEARQCSNTNRASYHNVTEAYIMACIQHTQTRPKYQYRFLALSAIGRNVIHITATTEREAREQSPAGCVMVFAGRLPATVEKTSMEVRYA